MRAYEIIPGTTVESIQLTERPAPVARAGQVLIDIRACAVNFRDVINISVRRTAARRLRASCRCRTARV